VPFLVDAVSFAAAALLLRALPPLKAQAPASALRAEIAEGLRFLFRRPLLRALVGAVAVNKLLTEAVFGIFVLYALHLGPAQYSLLFTAYALGGVLGGLCAARVRNLLGRPAHRPLERRSSNRSSRSTWLVRPAQRHIAERTTNSGPPPCPS
jgi:hypothetical protein